jgi:Alginate export
MIRSILCIAVLAATGTAAAQGAPAPAQGRKADSVSDMFRLGTASIDMRARYERVDESGFVEAAEALTLRTRFGFATAAHHGFSAMVEVADVRELIDDFNSTANGNTTVPVVLDPEGSEFNQAWLRYSPDKRFSATVGRQRIQWDNQRFFGSASFRQHEQTFDAAQLSINPNDAWAVRYAYLDKVNRVPGKGHPLRIAREQKLDAHLLNVSYKAAFGTITGYGYFVDNQDLPLQSAKTLGLRLNGSRNITGDDKLNYTVEWAAQDRYAQGSSAIDNDYALIEVAYVDPKYSLRLGHETLGGNGRAGFQTPFATLFAFNGWADRFLTTPANGLRDTYLAGTARLFGGDFILRYHDFRADRGGVDYGNEFDVRYSRNLTPQFLASVQYARFRSDSAAIRDADKLWLTLEWKYQMARD